MGKKSWAFLAAGLVLALALAAFVSPFSSKSPDGLNKFAAEQNIAQGESSWNHAPLADYKLAAVEHEGVSKGVAGAVGAVTVFGVMLALGFLLRRKKAVSEGEA